MGLEVMCNKSGTDETQGICYEDRGDDSVSNVIFPAHVWLESDFLGHPTLNLLFHVPSRTTLS